jgi:hypothetical protein
VQLSSHRSPASSRGQAVAIKRAMATMTDHEFDHAAVVDAWLEGAMKDLQPELWIDLFAASLETLWISASETLGEVTLHAIVDRVLHNAGARFAFLATLEIKAHGEIRMDGLRARVDLRHDPELIHGMRFVLVELLSVIGSLTAEILSPELHAELLRVALPTKSPKDKTVPGTAARPHRGHTQDGNGKR